MTRRQLLRLISTSYASLSLIGLGWIGVAWSASAPVSEAAVQGVSTGSTNSPSIPSYASFDTLRLPQIYAGQYALYNLESGQMLAQSPNMQPVPIASTTKLMTDYLVLKLANLNDSVTISQTAGGQIGSLMGIVPGQIFNVRSLLYGSLLVSGNDATFALAEYTGGLLLKDQRASTDAKIRRFVSEMNSQAAVLSMTSTHYNDPVGLDDNGHSNAVDLTKIASIDLQTPTLRAIIGTGDVTVTDEAGYNRFVLHNSNRLLEDAPYTGIIGGKTGFTPDAGHCLVTAATRNGKTMIAVILHTDSNSTEASAIEARKLLDAGFSLTHWQ